MRALLAAVAILGSFAASAAVAQTVPGDSSNPAAYGAPASSGSGAGFGGGFQPLTMGLGDGI